MFDWVEQYAPGFKSSVVGRDILTPPDLERIFGLTGGVCCSCLSVEGGISMGDVVELFCLSAQAQVRWEEE